MVTFSKKAQAAGFYYTNKSLRPDKPYRQFNTWMGDPARALLFRGIYNEIERHGLVEQAARVGKYLYKKLDALAQRYPNEIKNLRGKNRGTFLAWDSPRRDEVVKSATAKGVNIGGSGESTIRLRPMLVFKEHHGN
jgi:4-aminobutyrate aminotransferase/(S)-3-amino-2-methylpropionate transaminase